MESTLSLSEAAVMGGYSLSAVRRWIKTGAIEGHKTDGKWLVDEASLKMHLAKNGKSSKARQGARIEPIVEETHTEKRITDLEEQLKRERFLCDELRGKVDDLETKNDKLQEEIKAILRKDKGLFRWLRL